MPGHQLEEVCGPAMERCASSSTVKYRVRWEGQRVGGGPSCIRERAVKSGVAIALETDREVAKRRLPRTKAGARMRRQHMLTAKCAPREERSNEPGARRMRGRGSELGLSMWWEASSAFLFRVVFFFGPKGRVRRATIYRGIYIW